ncbi:MAG TPA: hypothetical protein DEQ61_24240, partial [Streptomyces sp.]|nr:hypothetical protein [Streptomyces sp.]
MRAAAPPPDRAQEAAADGLAHVIALLRDAGLNPDRGELADAVWLARWARPAGVLPGEGTD